MRALVLGTGFLGRAIINSLQKNGFSVESFSSSRKENITSNQHIGVIQNFALLRELLCKKPDLVVNTIWITKPGEYLNSKLNIDYADFAINLATLTKEYSIPHLISLGSCAEYHVIASNNSIHTWGLNSYVAEKVRTFEQSEKILLNSNTDFCWPRIFLAYGPHQNEARLFQSLINKGRNSDPILILDTLTRNDWISSFDIGEAICWIATKKLTGPIDIGTGIGHTNLEVWEIIQRELNSNSQLQEPTEKYSGLGVNVVASTHSQLFNTGWRPKLSLEGGIRLMIQS